MRVLATQIYKFDFKFKRKTIRRSIFSLDETAVNEAGERDSVVRNRFDIFKMQVSVNKI